ncbi:MAG: murein transglycosylase domain-containing protein [Pseudomonadales bacterium]
MNKPAYIAALIIIAVLSANLTNPAYADEDAFDALDKLLEDNFIDIDRSLEERYQLLNDALERGYLRLSAEVAESWGSDEARLPSKKEWVDYSSDLRTRRTINFETGSISIERIIDINEDLNQIVADLQSASTSILQDSVTDLASKDLALAYARESLAEDGIILPQGPISTKPVLANMRKPPEIAELSLLVEGVLKNPGSRQSYPNSLTEPDPMPIFVSTQILTNNSTKVSLELPLNKGYNFKLANQYIANISREAKKQNLPSSLLFAVMETESSFNPMARSPVPAFGLMQLVPSSGAMDAYEYVYGDKVLLGPDYLYLADNNVELGAAYLSLLHNRYLRHITDPLARRYCAIAAYNTGAGNVARSFTGSTNVRKAAKLINELTPAEVYDHLREKLPHEETRRYVEKVIRAMKKYTVYDSQTLKETGI